MPLPTSVSPTFRCSVPADAYTTCIREFVKKHEKAAAEAAGVEADRERSAKGVWRGALF